MLSALLAALNGRPIASAAAANPCGPPVVSVISCENSQPGDPTSDWQVSGAGDPTIQGFATSMSVNVGQTVFFKINTSAKSYYIDILRIGNYQGNGARKIVSGMLPTATLPQSQPACLNDTASTGLIDCGNWAVSGSWTVPSTAVSGLYIAHLVRTDTGGSSLIPFVVRNDGSQSDILFQTDDETWQAYNSYGGNSLYTCSVNCPPGTPQEYKGAAKVSYNRPWHSAADNAAGWFMYAEFPMISFLEGNGYDVSYTSGVDASQPGYALTIEKHKIYMTAGHDEYWSGQQRTNVTAARDAGVNLSFFSGNETFWKTRWEASIDGSGTANRTLVSYKETHYDSPVDPQDPTTWTGTWLDPRFSPPADGGNPQNSLTGQLFAVNSSSSNNCMACADVTVPSQYSKLRFWRNTRVANLGSGQSTTLDQGVGTLGYEWDVDADNGSRPGGLMDLSSTTDTTALVFTDYGSNLTVESATHHLTLYRAPSGALVFGAGTVQWSWGLDNSWTGSATDPAMQQATVNLLADMSNVQPFSLMSGLTPATESTDTSPPASTITAPAQGATVSDGSTLTISGSSTDPGGGVVAGVEVSTDGAATWHPVTTMSAANNSVTWSYSWIAHGDPTASIKARAVDDSGNLESPGPGLTINVTCPCSIWGPKTTPTTVDSGDSASTELGVKFKSDSSGYVTGIRFYKAATNTGTHIGNLWTANGTLLATGTFGTESASGWQELDFSAPVAVAANMTYVASYFAPNGHYSDDKSYFYSTPPMGTSPTITNVDSPPLHALRNTSGVVNGVYAYSSSSVFPASTDSASNYWVDVVFSQTTTIPAPTVTGVTPAAGATGISVSVAPAATFSVAVVPATVSFGLKDAGGNSVAGTVSFNSGDTVATFTPSGSLAAGTTYTATVSGAQNSNGVPMSGPFTWSFTTAGPVQCPCSIWQDGTPTGAVDSSDASAVNLGVQFQAGTNGYVTGVRFYKESDNTGTHVGGLWSSTGTLLASGTFSSESASGWQELDFASPVAVTAGTTYVASYHTNVGHYAQTVNGLVSAVANGPLTALASGGVYGYSSSSAFPSSSFSASNYWVDAVFSQTVTIPAPTVTGVTPSAGATGVSVSVAPTATFSVAVVPATVSFGLKDAGGNSVAGTVSFNSGDTVATFTPLVALGPGTTYTATVSGAQNSNGTPMSGPFTWSFTTATVPAPTVTKVTPAAGATGVSVSVKLTATFSQAVVPGTVSFVLKDSTGTIVVGTVSFNSTHTVATFTPSNSLAAGTTYTATVSGAQNSSGTPMSGPFTWSFTTGKPKH